MILNLEKKEKFLKTIFNHNQQLINLADSKSNIILRLIAFLIPLIFGLNTYSTIGLTSKSAVIYLLNISAILSILGLGISFLFSVQAIKARLESSDKGNLLFFKNINMKTNKQFEKIINEVTEEEMFSQYCTEIKDIANIAEIKYKNHKKSILFLGLGISIISFSYLIALLVNIF